MLIQLGLSPEQLQEAFDGWRQDVSTRQEVEKRLRIALGLQAIIMRDKLRPRREDAEALFEALLEDTELDREELVLLLQSNKGLAQRFDNLAMHVAAVHHVMSRITPKPRASRSLAEA